MKHDIQKGKNGRTIIVLIGVLLLLSCIAVFLFMKNDPGSGGTASTKSVEEMPGKNPEAASGAPDIGTAEYLQEKFGISPEKDKIWAHREYSVTHYRDPKAPKKVPSKKEKWPFISEKDDANLAGLDSVSALFYSYPARQLAIWSEEVVDPAKDNVLSGKSPTKLRFWSSARWGWSPENFFNPTIVWSNSESLKEQKVVEGALTGLYVMEAGGKRVMADFVWPLLVKDKEVGSLVLRCVLFADEPKCLYARAFLIGDPHLAFQNILLCSWCGYVGNVPGSEIWIGGATKDVPAPARHSQLPLDEYWVYFVRKKNLPVFKNHGSTGVFVPETLNELKYHGAWGGSVTLWPAKGHERAMVFALEDFGGSTGDDAETLIMKLRKGAASRRQRLAKMDWRPDLTEQIGNINDEIEIIAETLGSDNPLSVGLNSRHKDFSSLLSAGQTSAPGSGNEIKIAKALQALKENIDSSWTQATKDLILETDPIGN